MTKKWDELKQDFAAVVFDKGVDSVAGEIPAHPATVYRLVNGETKHPSQAVKAQIERIVEKHMPEGGQ